MKFVKILITLPTLAVICESAYEGFLPGIGNFKQNSKLKISIFDDTHGAQNSFNHKEKLTGEKGILLRYTDFMWIQLEYELV